MLGRHAVALTVVVACFRVVELHRAEDHHAGGPPAVSARRWAVSRPQLTDKTNRVELAIPALPTSRRFATINSSKLRRKCIDGTCHLSHR